MFLIQEKKKCKSLNLTLIEYSWPQELAWNGHAGIIQKKAVQKHDALYKSTDHQHGFGAHTIIFATPNNMLHNYNGNRLLQYPVLWLPFTLCYHLKVLQQYNTIMIPERTDNLPGKWRIWHSSNYAFGAVTFLLGSLLLFPFFAKFLNAAALSAWLYTVGSFTFCLADITEWLHYEQRLACKKDVPLCALPGLSFNFLLSVTGSISYLVGSALFIPQINLVNEGLTLFIVGSSFVFVSQTWKILRVILEGSQRKDIFGAIKQDLSGFLVDLFAGVGGSMYFIGAFIFFDPRMQAQIIGAAVFSMGGLFFYLSGAFMINRYFMVERKPEGSIKIASSDMRLDISESTEEKA